MQDPVFWLGLSLLLVSVSLTAVLVAALPALQELARAARSAEKLFDTLHREFPKTFDAIRLTSQEITELTEEFGEGVKSASEVLQQMDRSLQQAKQQAQQVQRGTHSLWVGLNTAWRTWQNYPRRIKGKKRRLK